MRPMTNRFILAALLTIGLAGGLAGCAKTGGASAVTADDMSLGNANAKVTMIEYASASCPHCARFNNEVFGDFRKKYIDTGKVHYVFREFLTPPVEFAAAGFLTARCAGKDKYFGVLDAIYHGQETIEESGDMHGGLLKIAESAGMSEPQFNACINDAAALTALNNRVQKYNTDDHIDSTPTFVINGKTLEGEQSMASLDKAVADAAAAAK